MRMNTTNRTARGPILLVPGLGLVLLAVLLVAPTAAGTSLRRAVRRTAPSPTAPAAGAATTIADRFAPGDCLTYRIEATQIVRLGTPGAASQAETELTLTGELRTKVYAKDGDDFHVGHEFSSMRLRCTRNGGAVPEEWCAKISDGLQGEVVARISGRGLWKEIRFPKSMGSESTNFLKSLMSATVFVLPEAPSARWEGTEEDPTGTYRAEYDWVGEADSDGRVTVRKQKKYLALHASGPGAKLTHRNSATVFGTFLAETGRLVGLRGEETMEIGIGGGMTSTVEARYRMTLVERTHEEGICKSLASLREMTADSYAIASFRPDFPADAGQETMTEAEIAEVASTHTLESLVSSLQVLERQDGLYTQEASDCFWYLRALFLHDPRNIERAREMASANLYGATMSGILIDILGSTGTEAAQRALLDLLPGDSMSEGLRGKTLWALSARPAVLPDVRSRLTDFAGSGSAALAGTAMQSLGRLARKGDAATGKEIVDFLMGRFDGKDTAVLTALGNAGHAAAFPLLAESAKSESEDVRVAAVLAMRWIETPEAEGAILRTAAGDDSDTVRIRAVESLSYRESDAVADALLRIASSDPSTDVRLKAAEVISARAGADPRYLEMLRQVSSRNDAEEVRREALQALSEIARR